MTSRLIGAAFTFALIAACGGADASSIIVIGGSDLPTEAITKPTGTVGPADTIPVYITLSLPSSSRTLTYDSSYADGNLPAWVLPTNGTLDNGSSFLYPFASYTSVVPVAYADCGTFGSCADSNSSPYHMVTPPAANSPSWASVTSLDMVAGDSRTFLAFDLVPTIGSVAPGVYTMNFARIDFHVTGLDAYGNSMSSDTNLGLTGSFSRTVTVVPLPGTAYLFATGLVGLVSLSGRSKLRA